MKCNRLFLPWANLRYVLKLLFVVLFFMQTFGLVGICKSRGQEVIERWEAVIQLKNWDALRLQIESPEAAWPAIRLPESLMAGSAEERALNQRAFAVEREVVFLIILQLKGSTAQSSIGLRGLAATLHKLERKIAASKGLPNATLVTALIRVEVLCLARSAIVAPDQAMDAHNLLRGTRPSAFPSAKVLLAGLVDDDSLIAKQENSIQSLPDAINYMAAAAIVGEAGPENQSIMANSPAWRNLMEFGKSESMRWVSLPAFLDFVQAGGNWESLTDSNVDSLYSKLLSKPSEYAYPMMQVSGPAPSQVRSLGLDVATRLSFEEAVTRYLVTR